MFLSQGSETQGTAIGAMAALAGTLTFCGRGATRTVFQSADGRHVYKVSSSAINRGGWVGVDDECQREEYKIASILRVAYRVDGIAPTSIWWVPDPMGRHPGTLLPVICQPYFPGDCRGDWAARDEAEKICETVEAATRGRIVMDDTADNSGNYRRDASGKVWIIDLGFCRINRRSR